MRARYAFVVLALLMFLLGGANLLWTSHQVDANNRKFCGVVGAITAVPVQKPANPAANPSRANQYQWYERFARLGRDLGC